MNLLYPDLMPCGLGSLGVLSPTLGSWWPLGYFGGFSKMHTLVLNSAAIMFLGTFIS